MIRSALSSVLTLEPTCTMALQNTAEDTPKTLMPSSTWKRNTLNFTDRITVKNLQANVQAGTDAWGRTKRTQPALISFTVFLAKPFDSAAQADKLDNSTIHYGVLSKAIQSDLADAQKTWQRSDGLGFLIEEAVLRVAGPVSIGSLSVDIFYPKGSLLGDGAGFKYQVSYAERTISTVLYLKNLRIPCLIGVNSNERNAKQPVVVNVWIENLQNVPDDYPSLERVVVEVSHFGYSHWSIPV